MTVIAASVREGRMASDTMAFEPNETKYATRKIFRVRGSLIGFAGDLVDIETALVWFRAGAPPDEAPPGNVSALILGPRGLSTWTPIDGELRIAEGAYAIGSGGPIARGAMMAGADVRSAAVIATRISTFCGGRVAVYTWRP